MKSINTMKKIESMTYAELHVARNRTEKQIYRMMTEASRRMNDTAYCEKLAAKMEKAEANYGAICAAIRNF